MGWQDAPVVEDTPAWASAPEVSQPTAEVAAQQPEFDPFEEQRKQGNFLMGALKGASNISASIPIGMRASFESMLAGEGTSGARRRYEQGKQELAQSFEQLANTESTPFQVGQLGMEIAGTSAVQGPRVAIQGSKIADYLGKIASGTGAGAVGGAMVGQDPQTIGLGAGVGGAFSAAVPVASRLMTGNLDRARNALSRLLGGNTDEAQRVLAAASPDVTSAQALEMGGQLNPTAAAGMGILRGEVRNAPNPQEAADFYSNLTRQQQAGREAALNRAAMGGTEEQTAAAIRQMGQRLERNLGPVREAQIGSANIGQDIPNLLRQADELDQQALMFGGTSAKADELRRTAQQIQDWGYQPLDISPITNKISKIIDDPALGSSENVTRVMQDVTGGLNQWVKQGGGVIDANALYMKRKEAVNEAVSKLLSGAEPAVTKRLTAKLTTELKPLIDDAMEASGATGWKDYIRRYSKGFEEMDRVALAGELRSLPPAQFMKVMQGNDPELVARFGNWNTIKGALGGKVGQLENVAGQMQRDINIAAKETDKSAIAAAQKIFETSGFRGKLPNMLNHWITLANTAIGAGEMVLSKKMYSLLDKAARDPKAMVELLATLPPEQRNAMLRYATQASGTAAPAVVGAATMDQQ